MNDKVVIIKNKEQMNELIEIKIETKEGVNFVSSRVIAYQLGKRHADVVNQISKISNNENVRGYFVLSSYVHNGNNYNEYLLTKDGFTLYMFNIQGYNEFKMAYINRFNEMEKALKEMQPKLPQTYKEALKELLVQVEENERLQIENKDMKPKAEYFDEVIDRNGLTNFRDTAKLFGVYEKSLIFFLIDKKYIYRDQKGKLKTVAKHMGTYFELKEWAKGEKAGTQTLITAKGRDHFFKLINKIKL